MINKTRRTKQFYHIKNLQSTKTAQANADLGAAFYHIKNLQSTKTLLLALPRYGSFITLRIYKVLKLVCLYCLSVSMFYHIKNLQSTKTDLWKTLGTGGFITLRIYKVLKRFRTRKMKLICFITLRIYKVLKPQQRLYALIHS